MSVGERDREHTMYLDREYMVEMVGGSAEGGNLGSKDFGRREEEEGKSKTACVLRADYCPGN